MSMSQVLVKLVCVECIVFGWHSPRQRHFSTGRKIARRSVASVDDICSVAEALGLDVVYRNGGYWALCPFHAEKTPSFTLSPEKGVYYCFGCGAKGNAVHLTQHVRDCSYREATEWLAEHGESSNSMSSTPRLRVTRKKKKIEHNATESELHLVLKALAAYYAHSLCEISEAGAARMYLRERGISPETAARFGLGFAPSSSIDHISTTRLFLEDVLRYENNKIPVAALDYIGVTRSQRDRFAGRLVLPIRDAAGNTVGFGSRVLPLIERRKRDSKEKSTVPKYVNSPTSSVFAKSKLLFGLDQALASIRDQDEAIIVEGFFDVLALHDCGIHNVVAALGVSLTKHQIEHAARFSDSRAVVLLLDSDSAGKMATDKLCASVLPSLVDEAGLDVSVSHLKPFKDAADFVNSTRTSRHLSSSSQDNAVLKSHFMDTIIANKRSWQHRRDKALLGDLFKPGAR